MPSVSDASPSALVQAPRRLAAVVLAGGAGARFGGGKLLAPWGDGFLIEGALDAAAAAPVVLITVVTGADGRVEGAVRAWAERRAQADRLRLTHAADHAEGMAATLRAGIAALPSDTGGAFIFLGDMPRIPGEVAIDLATRLGPGVLAAVPTFEGRRGHPALFSAALFPRLLALAGDEGARSILRGLGPGLAEAPMTSPGILQDVDTPEDLDALGRDP